MCTTHQTQFETSSELSQHKEAHRSTVRNSTRKHTEALRIIPCVSGGHRTRINNETWKALMKLWLSTKWHCFFSSSKCVWLSRVNMAPTEHHLVIEHPSCAYKRRWMVAVLCASIWMQPYDQMPVLEKCVWSFYIIPFFKFFCAIMGMEKRNNSKKRAQPYM